MCISRNPHRRDWNFLGRGGFGRPKNLKKCIKLNWNFHRGGERIFEKIPSLREVWIFSGTKEIEIYMKGLETFCDRPEWL